MEAFQDLTYHIEINPGPHEVGTIVIHTDFVCHVDIEPILTRSRYSCSLPSQEFIEDESSPRKQQLYRFLTETGVVEDDSITLIVNLIGLARELTSSVGYRPHYALSIWLTLHLFPSSQEPILDDSQIEEAILQASLDEYESNIGFRPASKFEVGSLSRSIYKRKRKTSLIADKKRKRKTSLIADKKKKRKTGSVADDRCTICLEEFKTGQEVVTLPCGHEYDDMCIVEWFNVSHVCPLCRFELPCEDDDVSQILTTVF